MTIIERILSQMSNVSKPQRKFVKILFLTIMVLPGKMNFRNLSRFSSLSEMSYLRHFRQFFDFMSFNHILIKETIPSNHRKIAAMDCSFLAKSGQKTYGIDSFFNSQTNRSQRGLELSLLSIIDVDDNKAYTLSAQQTPPSSIIGIGEETRMDFYLKHLKDSQTFIENQKTYHIVADGFYAKKRFIHGVQSLGFHLISKLRHDANLRYLYEGPQKAGKGAKKRYDGKVRFDDLSRFEWICDVEKNLSLYSARLNSPQFKRDLRVVYLLNCKKPKKPCYTLLFSTDLFLRPIDIFYFYKARFQIEFIFRDAKQFTGLTHCQARKKEAIHFHLNASLSALNLLRKQDQAVKKNTSSKVCSIASWKARYLNEHLIERFISYLDLQPILIKNHPRYEELRNYGTIAA